MMMNLTRCTGIALAACVLAAAPAEASSQGDAGRALIQTVLQSGLQALEKDRATQPPTLPGRPATEESPLHAGEAAARRPPPLRNLMDSLGIEAMKDEAQEEMAAYVGKLADKATASIVKRLDRDGEIRARLQHNMHSLEVLCWGLVIYLFLISAVLLFSMRRLLSSNRRMREQLDRMAARVEALAANRKP